MQVNLRHVVNVEVKISEVLNNKEYHVDTILAIKTISMKNNMI
jgi:hypothetical protein